MIVGGQTEARAQLSSTIIDYHEPFDQGFTALCIFRIGKKKTTVLQSRVKETGSFSTSRDGMPAHHIH